MHRLSSNIKLVRVQVKVLLLVLVLISLNVCCSSLHVDLADSKSKSKSNSKSSNGNNDVEVLERHLGSSSVHYSSYRNSTSSGKTSTTDYRLLYSSTQVFMVLSQYQVSYFLNLCYKCFLLQQCFTLLEYCNLLLTVCKL